MVAGRRRGLSTDWRSDTLLAVGLFVVAGAVLVAVASGDETPSPVPLAVMLLALMHGALALRRRWPVPVLAVNLTAVVGYQLLDYPAEPMIPSVLVALYTVAATGHRHRSLVVGAVTCVLVAVTLMVTEPGTYYSDLLGALGWVIVALALGEAVRYHRAYTMEVEDRAARAEASREAEARRLVAEERMRIARDVHDLLAHSVAAINVQAGVVAHLIEQRRQPDAQTMRAIGEILHRIAETSRHGVESLQATLELLRSGEAADPVPGLAGVPALIAPLRAGGTEVRMAVVGEQRPLPQTHEVAAFRIIQEALTNAVKHGRPGRIEVTVAYEPAALRVTVADNGHCPATTEPGRSGGGYGILGMRERAHSVGGQVSTGPRAGGGFEVAAVLPLPPTPAEPVPAGDQR